MKRWFSSMEVHFVIPKNDIFCSICIFQEYMKVIVFPGTSGRIRRWWPVVQRRQSCRRAAGRRGLCRAGTDDSYLAWGENNWCGNHGFLAQNKSLTLTNCLLNPNLNTSIFNISTTLWFHRPLFSSPSSEVNSSGRGGGNGSSPDRIIFRHYAPIRVPNCLIFWHSSHIWVSKPQFSRSSSPPLDSGEEKKWDEDVITFGVVDSLAWESFASGTGKRGNRFTVFLCHCLLGRNSNFLVPRLALMLCLPYFEAFLNCRITTDCLHLRTWGFINDGYVARDWIDITIFIRPLLKINLS